MEIHARKVCTAKSLHRHIVVSSHIRCWGEAWIVRVWNHTGDCWQSQSLYSGWSSHTICGSEPAESWQVTATAIETNPYGQISPCFFLFFSLLYLITLYFLNVFTFFVINTMEWTLQRRFSIRKSGKFVKQKRILLTNEKKRPATLRNSYHSWTID